MKTFFLVLVLLPVLSFRTVNTDNDIFFGDSITFGNELQTQQYTARWPAQYCNAVSTNERNFARSGGAMTPGLNSGRPVFDINEVPAHQPDDAHIFISYWVNDYSYGGTPAAFAAATSAAVDGIIAKGWPAAKIVLCFNYLPASAPNWPYMTDAIAREWLAALRGVQQAKRTSFLDFYTAIYNRPDNASYSGDYIHPTAEWNGIMKQLTQTNIEGPSNTLPASIISFSGQRQGSTTVLKWTVAQEQNVASYDIERSENGSAWTKIGSVNSNGNSIVQRGYSFTDNASNGTKQLYRLKTVDKNGAFKFSNVVVVNSGRPNVLSLGGLFPNPASAKLNVSVDAPAKDNVILQLMDATGRVVSTKNASVEGGSTTLEVNVAGLQNGSYFVKINSVSNHVSAVGRFVKE